MQELNTMSDTPVAIASGSLVKHSQVNFQPPELDRIKACVFKNIGVVARAFCESELSMMCALTQGKAQIGTVDNYEGKFCIFIEYQGIQVLKPVHAIH